MKKLIAIWCVLSLLCVQQLGAKRVYEVDGTPGYNCWPMIQSVGKRLICIYTCGKVHDPGEKGRGAYAKYSDDGGRSWSDKVLMEKNEEYGTSSIGKGVDKDGNALFWLRRMGINQRMALYRTSDGETFELISTPSLNPLPMQITDIYHTPEGLECLWFSDDYSRNIANKSWGVLVSRDNGKSWEQRIIEKDLKMDDWPTEPSVVVYGDGRLLAIARSETGNQFQLTSYDWGKTWTKQKTNIDDVSLSTPSLILNKSTGMLYNYYYQRGSGLLKVRKVNSESIFNSPQFWPEPKVMAQGGTERPCDSGNVNAVAMKKKHYITYYSGDPENCKILVLVNK